MAYTYAFCDADYSSIKRTDEDGNVAFVPAAEGNRDYAEYLASGVTATAYVAPPSPPELTTEEKVNRLLSDYGLTGPELLSALEA
jgi:hypothetical protein